MPVIVSVEAQRYETTTRVCLQRIEIQHTMTASEKEIKPNLQFTEEEEEFFDETDIIDCIDSCLNYLGRGVAYTVYLNWSAVDRKMHRGILGDPRSFRTSLFGLFGEEQGSLIETFLVKKLKERFPIIRSAPGIVEESDFVSVITWLTERSRKDDFALEEELRDKMPAESFFDFMERPMDMLGKWFEEEVSRVGTRIRILSNLSPGMRKENLQSEVARIGSNYEDAVERLSRILKSVNRKWYFGQQNETKISKVLKDIGTNIAPASGFPKRGLSESDGERGLDPLAAIADALNACSELVRLSRQVENMKESITGSNSAP